MAATSITAIATDMNATIAQPQVCHLSHVGLLFTPRLFPKGPIASPFSWNAQNVLFKACDKLGLEDLCLLVPEPLETLKTRL